MKILRILLCATFLLLGVAPASAIHAQPQSISCRNASSLIQSTRIVAATTCFTVTPPRGSTALRVDLVVSAGAYDLYVRQGSAPALSDADKVNVGAISGSMTYVYPATGPFTVAVARTSSSGSAQLMPFVYQTTQNKCSGSMCTVSFPLTSIPGAKFGDQAMFGMPGATAGQINAKATWTSKARLSAVLYGPGVSRTGVTQTVLAREDGTSPLALSYGVRSTKLISGGKWAIGLSNASKGGGAVSSGTLTITYPK